MEEFDLFTFIASIINFLVLVFLLRTFLFKRVLKAIEERRKTVERTWDEAEEERSSAEAEKESYREKQEELKKSERELRTRARDKAGEIREELVRKAREEVSGTKEEWLESFEKEKEKTLSRFEEQAAKELAAALREVLDDLSDSRLEEAIIRRFMEKIRQSTVGDKIREAEEITVKSGFSIEEELLNEIVRTLAETSGNGLGREDVRFETDKTLVCGIEVQAGNYRIGWNIDRYLREAAEELAEKTRK